MPEGDKIARQALAAVFSREVLASAAASPLAATVLVAAATVRKNLVLGPGGNILSALAAVSPKKGGEIYRLVPEYCARNANDPAQAVVMAIRDFFASWFAWCFPRCTDGRTPDLWGSAFCLTTAVDYTDVVDAAGSSDSAPYLAAASEGLACLDGAVATQVLKDLVIADAFMRAKEEATAAADQITDGADFIEAAGGPVTPNEALRARIWDGVYYVILRAIMSTSGYEHLTDDLGNFSAIDRCGKIKRAVDNGIRYDEIIDLASDYAQREWLNELCLALATVGGHGARGYGDACARITDDAIACDCGESGHEAAAEISMGNLLFYLVAPRYVLWRQMAAFSAIGGSIKRAYAWRAAGTRLRQVACTHLLPGDTLHAPDWQPLWTMSTTPVLSPVVELAHRAVLRSFPDHPSEDAASRCEAAARSVLVACDQLSDPPSLRALDRQWCHFFDTVLDSSVTGSAARQQADVELRPLIARLWRKIIVGYDDGQSADPADGSDEQLYLDVDHAIRRTFSLPLAEGLALRRAFLGVTTSAAELSGLNPCARLSDGIATLFLAENFSADEEEAP